jgi:membrane-bound serine protease (ClpP class)
MDPIVWSILLLLAGLLLILIEVFVPSGGILAFLSISTVAAAVGMAFYNRGAEVGTIFLLVTAVAVPVVLTGALRYWPQTAMGKRVLLGIPTEEDVLPNTPQLRRLRELVGKVGVAKSMMLPSGAVSVGGGTYDAVSDGEAIEAGQRVRVIEVHGNRVVVSLTQEMPTASALDRANADILNQPIESLGLDDDPLA